MDKVKDTATVKWQIADLGGVDGLRQTHIVRVHGRRGVRDFQDFCLLAELQLEIHPQNGLDAELWIGAQRVTTCALVRTCDPRVGMGIEFVGLN